jgi:hypothetical protein
MRLLSLFFDHIYIPRTHLITQLFSFQSTIAAEVLSTRDVQFLDDTGVLTISQLPGLDAQADAERIIMRSSLTAEIKYADSKAYIAMFPKSRAFVPSNREAQANTMSFSEYGQLLESSSPPLARQFSNLVDGSTLRDIPFFHEIFVRRLKSEFPSTIFEKLWRDTNSIYLTTGGIGIDNIIPYFNHSIESLAFRHAPSNIDRYLLSPQALQIFLSLFLSTYELTVFFDDPIERSCEYLLNYGLFDTLLATFRTSYFTLVSEISQFTKQPSFARDLSSNLIAELYTKALEGTLDHAPPLLRSSAKVRRPKRGQPRRSSYGDLFMMLNTLKNSLRRN